jgi:hypothetical protein
MKNNSVRICKNGPSMQPCSLLGYLNPSSIINIFTIYYRTQWYNHMYMLQCNRPIRLTLTGHLRTNQKLGFATHTLQLYESHDSSTVFRFRSVVDMIMCMRQSSNTNCTAIYFTTLTMKKLDAILQYHDNNVVCRQQTSEQRSPASFSSM